METRCLCCRELATFPASVSVCWRSGWRRWRSRTGDLQNFYSVPWQRIGELLPIRITENELIVYGSDHCHERQAEYHVL